jgi:NAD-dependent deacetylase
VNLVSISNRTSKMPSDPASSLQSLASRLAKARGVVVLTGAGVSAESGIRTFRDAMDEASSTMAGLWKDFDPAKLATPEAFDADPALVTRWYDVRRRGCLAAMPNPGHIALAQMQRHVESIGGCFTLLTQNVDRLHQRAGSAGVVELHGSIIEWRCTLTGRRVTPPPAEFATLPMVSPFDPRGLLRPDVVWFGEMLPEAALMAAQNALETCDVFISVGTSAQVYPAAGFVGMASANGAFTAEVNREPTPISRGVDACLHGASGEVLPRVVAQTWPGAGTLPV